MIPLGVRPRLEGKQRTLLSSRVAMRVLPPPARGPGTLIPSAQRLVWAANTESDTTETP